MNRFPSIPWRLICAVSLLTAAALGMRLRTLSEVVDSAYCFDCTVTAVDANTFAPLKIVGNNGPAVHGWESLRQTYTASILADGTLRVSGMAYQPRGFGIAVEGYSATVLTITRDTRPEVEVLMTRLGGSASN